MSRAEELAQAYADAVSTHRLESLYGTSKSYTLEKARERDEAHAALSAELRRLAAVEAELIALKKAIGDAEPKGWLCVRTEFGKVVSRCIAMNRQDPPKDHRDSVEPLYTLKGIK